MKRLQTLIPTLGLAAISAMTLMSCGGDDTTCGTGTHEVDGVCVPDTTCGDGTQAQNGECVPVCAAGTKADMTSGQCVPDGSVICPQGTTFQDGQCKLDANACGDGTVLVNGECILEDDNLMADLEEAAEPNDTGASPAGMLTLGAVDSSTVIHGCVNPRADADMDGNLDPDFDLWFITASGPTTIELTADGVHGLSAGFVVINADQALGTVLANFRRFGINLTGDTSKRQVYLPAAGTYGLLMTDSRSLFLDSGAAGSAEACYYTTIKRIATPAATPLTLPTTNGTDNNTVKLYSYSASAAGRILDTSINTTSAALFPAYLTLRGAQNTLYSSERGVGSSSARTIGGMAMGDTVTVVADMEYNYALSPQAYTISAYDIGADQLPLDGSVTLTKRNGATAAAPYADFNYLYVDVPAAGTLMNFNVAAATTATPPVALPIDIVIARQNIITRDPVSGARVYDAFVTVNAFGGTGRSGGFANQFVRFAQPGRYYFIVQDPAGISGEMYTVTSRVTTVTPTAITYGTPLANQALPTTSSGFHTLDLTNPVWVQFGVTGTNFPTGTATARLSFYDLAGEGWLRTGTGTEGTYVIALGGSTTNADGSTPLNRILLNDTRDFLVRVEAVGTPGAGPMYSLDFKNRDHVNLMTIMPGTPISRMNMDDLPAATSATAFGIKRFIVSAANGSGLTAVATPTVATADISIRRVDAAEVTVTTVNAGAAGVMETFGPVVVNAAPANWVAFEVQNRTLTTNTNLNMTLTATAPPYNVTNGAIAWADACAGAGATTLGTEQDDEIIAARPLGFTASFFGTPATHYIVMANGFVKLGDMAVAAPTCSFGCFSNQDIPQVGTDGANGVVAPFWDDLQHATLCVKEEATKVTVQWVGVRWNTTDKVAFQAIINMNGTVNFVYNTAANHTADGSTATIGLEKQDGLVATKLSYNAVNALAGMARTFTPNP